MGWFLKISFKTTSDLGKRHWLPRRLVNLSPFLDVNWPHDIHQRFLKDVWLWTVGGKEGATQLVTGTCTIEEQMIYNH